MKADEILALLFCVGIAFAMVALFLVVVFGFQPTVGVGS